MEPRRHVQGTACRPHGDRRCPLHGRVRVARPKTGPTPHHRGFLQSMAKGDRRRHAFERVLVSTLERLSKKLAWLSGSVYASWIRPVQRLRARSWRTQSCHSTDPDPQVGNDNFIDDDKPRPRCAAGRMVLDGTFAFRDRDGRAAWCASRAERRSTAWRALRSASHRQFGQQRIGVARCRCPASRRHAAESVIAASTMSEPPLAYAKLNRGEREALGPARGQSPPCQVIRRNGKQDRLAHGRV